MRTRTFLGLILLVAALMVASTPALLTPASAGIERLAVDVGMLPNKAAIAKAERKQQKAREKELGTTVDPRLELKGFTREEDGDMRDTQPVGEREINVRGRLASGSQRLGLPGERPGRDAYSPPFAAEDGVLLDIDGCPVFRPDADVATMLADPTTQKLYADKVASADDAAYCQAVFQERIAVATAVEEDRPTGAAQRQLAGLQYEGFASLGITMREYEMLTRIFGFEDMPDVLEAARSGDTSATTTSETVTTTTEVP